MPASCGKTTGFLPRCPRWLYPWQSTAESSSYTLSVRHHESAIFVVLRPVPSRDQPAALSRITRRSEFRLDRDREAPPFGIWRRLCDAGSIQHITVNHGDMAGAMSYFDGLATGYLSNRAGSDTPQQTIVIIHTADSLSPAGVTAACRFRAATTSSIVLTRSATQPHLVMRRSLLVIAEDCRCASLNPAVHCLT